jgi:syntaxin 16
VNQLQNLHTSRLKVTFGDASEAEQDHEINSTAAQITRLFQRSENSLKTIATVGNARGTNLPAKERIVRLNVMRALATEIQTLSKDYRHMQKDFALRLKDQEQAGNEFFSDDSGESKGSFDLEHALDYGMSAANQQQLAQMEQTANAREQEIIRVAQSVNELAQLFRELNVLVIEQGTVLDRIDYNVERTLANVKEGREELVKADKSMNSRAIICIGILFLLVIILSIVLYYKKKDK